MRNDDDDDDDDDDCCIIYIVEGLLKRRKLQGVCHGAFRLSLPTHNRQADNRLMTAGATMGSSWSGRFGACEVLKQLNESDAAIRLSAQGMSRMMQPSCSCQQVRQERFMPCSFHGSLLCQGDDPSDAVIGLHCLRLVVSDDL